MAKYFMGGTKYEPYERMMMSSRRSPKFYEPQRKKNYPSRKGGREGDLYRNYAGIAKDCYGYNVSVLDLRNPTRSDGNNLLHLVNKYMDIYKVDHKNLAAKAKAEKYAKILSKTLINSSDANYGQNQFFYDSAEGLLTIPPIQSLELMFSASRSRRLMLVPIVQSITGQLQKNYGKEGSEIIVDNCQLNIFGGFAPASQTAEEMSKALGNRTVLSGSINNGKDKSQSLQMMERPLMSADELKSMPKGAFIVMKTGVHPMKVKLRLFLEWGITFSKPYEVPEQSERPVVYATKNELINAIKWQSRTKHKLKNGGIKASNEVI